MLTSEHNSMNRDEHIIELTDEERAHMVTAMSGLPDVDVGDMDDQLLTEIELHSNRLPDRLVKHLIGFRKNSNEYGMLLIRNLPIDSDLPPTPPDDNWIAWPKTSYMSEYVLLGVMLHLGDPIAYEDEKGGALIQNICPIRGKEEAQENNGSIYLEFHTEDAFHPHKPDYVGLLCLRPDREHNAVTAAASVRRILAIVPSTVQALLRQPLYRIRLSSSFMSGGEEVLFSPPLAVLSGDLLEPELSADFYGMEATTPAAQLALKTLEDALLKVALEHRLIPGDLMIIDNKVAVHARTAFHPKYDGQDRWLQRLFIVRDFQQSRASRSRGSHVCTPLAIEFATGFNGELSESTS